MTTYFPKSLQVGDLIVAKPIDTGKLTNATFFHLRPGLLGLICGWSDLVMIPKLYWYVLWSDGVIRDLACELECDYLRLT